MNGESGQQSESAEDLKISSYFYELPSELIADRPAPQRDQSKLLVYQASTDQITHALFYQLPQFLSSEHHLVFNQSKVIPCRLFGRKVKGGGQCEVFLLQFVPQNHSQSAQLKECYPVYIKASGKRKLGEKFILAEEKLQAEIIDFNPSLPGSFLVQLSFLSMLDSLSPPLTLLELLDQYARVPIPPYIRHGQSDEQDKKDYQTVYSKIPGSVAAPTAGLHFTEKVFNDLKAAQIDHSFVTLHVGAGTFSPVKSENIEDHKMHEEEFLIEKKDWEKILQHQDHLIAVGTTTLRVLETTHQRWGWKDLSNLPNLQRENLHGRTDIFLHPGKKVHSIRGLITNFHLPESSLLMLVSALIGRKKVLEIYQEAIRHQYRFFSYGDAMLILL